MLFFWSQDCQVIRVACQSVMVLAEVSKYCDICQQETHRQAYHSEPGYQGILYVQLQRLDKNSPNALTAHVLRAKQASCIESNSVFCQQMR